MKFKLGEQFWRIWCFPIQRDSCTCMPERRFKECHSVTWLALKGLCLSTVTRHARAYAHPHLMLSAVRCREKKKEKKPKIKNHASLSGTFITLWNFFWLLTLITCFSVGNNLTTNNASALIFSVSFHVPLQNISHGFTTNKTKKIMVLVAMVTTN